MKSKEARFKELIAGIDINRPVVDFEKYPTSIFWFKDGKCYFEYKLKTNYFLVNWDLVWSVFGNEGNMKYGDVQDFIKVMVEQHFKLKGVIPYLTDGFSFTKAEEHFKLKGFTPNQKYSYVVRPVEQHFKSINKLK